MLTYPRRLRLRSVFVLPLLLQPSHSLWNGRVWQGLRVLLVHDLEEALEKATVTKVRTLPF